MTGRQQAALPCPPLLGPPVPFFVTGLQMTHIVILGLGSSNHRPIFLFAPCPLRDRGPPIPAETTLPNSSITKQHTVGWLDEVFQQSWDRRTLLRDKTALTRGPVDATLAVSATVLPIGI
jgi:hypothetical protein